MNHSDEACKLIRELKEIRRRVENLEERSNEESNGNLNDCMEWASLHLSEAMQDIASRFSIPIEETYR